MELEREQFIRAVHYLFQMTSVGTEKIESIGIGKKPLSYGQRDIGLVDVIYVKFKNGKVQSKPYGESKTNKEILEDVLTLINKEVNQNDQRN